jgi:hypothetical protein
MIGIFFTLLIGLGIIFLSRSSVSDIAITIGDQKYSNIPLYAITLGTYLLGILLAWIIEVPQTIVTALHIMGLGHTINSGKNTIIQLQNKINKLETENIKLREHNHSIITNRKTDLNYRSNIIQNFLQRLNLK